MKFTYRLMDTISQQQRDVRDLLGESPGLALKEAICRLDPTSQEVIRRI